MFTMFRQVAVAALFLASSIHAWVAPNLGSRKTTLPLSATWFATQEESAVSLDKQKAALLQLGAALDRGQSYNPTSGEYVSDFLDSCLVRYVRPLKLPWYLLLLFFDVVCRSHGGRPQAHRGFTGSES